MSQRSNCESSSSQTASWPEYRATVAAVFDEYGPETYRFVNIEDWPDEIPTDGVVLSRTTDGTTAARFDRDAVPEGINATAIVQPADYTVPLEWSPLAEITDPETLSDAGELIYELFDLITFITTSPSVEPTHRREMAKIIEDLHETYDYSLADIKERLILVAQQRGDLPSKD
jgi:hypothetical protein